MTDEAKKAGHPDIPDFKKSPAMRFHDKIAKLNAIFGHGAGKFVEHLPGIIGMIDIVGLDDWLKTQHPDYDEEKESMADFLTRQYGKDVSDWVSANLGKVM